MTAHFDFNHIQQENILNFTYWHPCMLAICELITYNL